MSEQTEDKPEAKERFEYTQVPTEYGIMIKDNEQPTKEITQASAILEVLNMVNKIYKATCQ